MTELFVWEVRTHATGATRVHAHKHRISERGDLELLQGEMVAHSYSRESWISVNIVEVVS